MAPIREENRSGKSQLRRLRQKKKKVSKQLNHAKERLEKDMVKAEEISIKLAEWKRLIELHKKGNACIERCIGLTLEILPTDNQRDFATADLLGSEMLAKMEEEIQAFMNAGGGLE